MTNKEKARAYYTAVNEYDQVKVEKMVEENYIQHNPFVPTGRAAFISLLPKLKQYGSRIENQRMLQDGPYVVMHHVWKNATPFGKEELVAFHVVRFDKAGLIAEHWNVNTEPASPNLSGRTSVDGETTIGDRGETEHNKARIAELFGQWTSGKMGDLPRFFHPDFHQHHPQAGDGIQGLIEATESGKLAVRCKRQHKVLGEGNFVLSISEGIHREKPAARYDLFRMEKGKIAEHWNIGQEIPTANVANENTMFNF